MNTVKIPCATSMVSSKDAIFYQKKINRRILFPSQLCGISRQFKSSKFTVSASIKTNNPPLVVVGSANADIYVEIDRLPKEGETISAKTGQTLAGGKGANQAACGGKLDYPTYFLGQVGEDAHGKLIIEALKGGGVRLDYVNVVTDVPTGHAVVMLQNDGQNSIIIVGGSNMSGWPQPLGNEFLEVVRRGGIVLLQREIPDDVNIQVAKVFTFILCYFVFLSINLVNFSFRLLPQMFTCCVFGCWIR